MRSCFDIRICFPLWYEEFNNNLRFNALIRGVSRIVLKNPWDLILLFVRSSMNLRFFLFFIMGNSIESKDLFLFFVIKSSLNSKFDALYEGIEYSYAEIWKNTMFDDMRRNVLCVKTWKNTIFDNMRRNVLCVKIWKNTMFDDMRWNVLKE